MYIYSYIIFIILMIIFILFLSIFFKNMKTKEKLSPFECGFDPFSLSRVPFSLKFFFIAIIFLIFDVEIIIIMPYPILLFNKSFSLMMSFMLINLIIMFGLLLEWKNGMIDWMK
nr:NADH dehydrogenase subunit 3 [Amblyomma sp.]BCW91252.1 NADH dehydrogenase subunit 3 [Amblyomma sp.]BCW91265.1 NADH dehydrogenase subunit 3 [Amblyomma sp.]BCW91278.1 NADH dehydrogenase subunit 3 [Amblyomma sp.]BCW91291.1 NADH dehydrogenase subunit 3 [Amblyomma sp.]